MANTVTRPTRSPGGGNVYRGRKVRGRRWKRAALVLVGIAVVIGLAAAGVGLAYFNNLDDRLRRTDAFDGLTSGRPSKVVEGSFNILVLGSDSRDGLDYNPKDPSSSPASVGGERADTIMVLHIPASHDKAYVISIPRDTYVSIPRHEGHGGRRSKINAAFAWGGIPLAVKTVEEFTGVKMDHVVKVDFGGFQGMTDALGGVKVYVNETTTDPRSKRTFRKGWNALDGEAALDYVRQRYGLPNGDFDRVQRQQIFLRALMKEATEKGTLTNPVKLKAFLDAAAKALTVDDGFSLTDMALQVRKLRPDDLSFVTSPHLGSRRVDGQSVVVSDKEKAAALWESVRQDKLDDWLATNKPNDVTAGR